MKLNEPDYSLENTGDMGWQFVLSSEMEATTVKFHKVLESGGGKRGLTVALREFLNEHAGHIDALSHYGMCKMEEGKPLDGFAFAHAAVAVGRAAFPPGFRLENNCLPGGWIENRPFLRALSGLMQAQRAMFQTNAAISTAYELIGCDEQDRMGVRMVLPFYLLQKNRDAAALEIFDRPVWKGSFGPAQYLHALALIRLGKTQQLAPVWKECFEHNPKTANYLLDRHLPRPKPDSPYGIVLGGDFEAWAAASEQHRLWEKTTGALEALAEARTKHLSDKEEEMSPRLASRIDGSLNLGTSPTASQTTKQTPRAGTLPVSRRPSR